MTDQTGFVGPHDPSTTPPWLREIMGVVDTRTKVVAKGLPPRDPAEPVFFPGQPARQEGTGWAVMLADGSRVDVDGATIVGRKPYPIEAFPGAAMLAVDDRAKTVSKLHAVLLPHDGGLFVLDLNSTNGSAVVANGRRQPVTSTEFVAVPDGSVVELGSYLLGADHIG